MRLRTTFRSRYYDNVLECDHGSVVILESVLRGEESQYVQLNGPAKKRMCAPYLGGEGRTDTANVARDDSW